MPEQFLAPDPPAAQSEQFLPPDDPIQPPQRQVAAGQPPPQVAAGGGAIGPGSILSSAGQWLKGLDVPPSPTQQQPTAAWPSEGPAPLDWLAQMGKKAWDLPEKLAPEAEEHLKNFMASLAGIKREPTQPAKTPAIPTAKPTTQLREAPPEIESAIQTAAQKYNLEPKLVRAMIQSESNFKPKAVGKAGELGLMQLLPQTRTDLGMSDEDATDIEKNVDAGAGWLRMKIDAHGGDLHHGLAAYNGSGPKAQQYADRVLALYSGAPAPAPATVDPPPGFVIEPKPEDFASLPADVRAVQTAGKYLSTAAKREREVVGGMASEAMRVSMPYISWQLYKKHTGQPNELDKIPGNIVKTFGLLLAGGGGLGEAAVPEAEAAEEALKATEAAPKAIPKQLGMGAIEGEYLPPPTAGQLPSGQYAQPPVQQSALPPGQYEPPPPPTRLALPQKASAIPLPETFPQAREPIIKTTPSEPLPPLRTTAEDPLYDEAVRHVRETGRGSTTLLQRRLKIGHGRAVDLIDEMEKNGVVGPAKGAGAREVLNPAATSAVSTPVAEAEAPAAGRTAVGTEGQVKGMRLVQRGGKWYDSRTGEEYKWKVRTN